MLDDPLKNDIARVTKATKVRAGFSDSVYVLATFMTRPTQDGCGASKGTRVPQLPGLVFLYLNLLFSHICDTLVIDECLLCVVVILIFQDSGESILLFAMKQSTHLIQVTRVTFCTPNRPGNYTIFATLQNTRSNTCTVYTPEEHFHLYILLHSCMHQCLFDICCFEYFQ